MTLFRPATGEVRAKGVVSVTNAVLHPWLQEQLLLQPGMQDRIGHRDDSFGSHLSGGRTEQGHELGSSIAQIFMWLQSGFAS